jgi:mRNA interferase MazF
MRRGEIWTIAGGPGYAGKPRPAVIVQDDLFRDLNSVTVCLLSSDLAETPAVRPLIEASEANGLRAPSQIMVDKITTTLKDRLGSRIGHLSDQDLLRLNRAITVFLGLAS